MATTIDSAQDAIAVADRFGAALEAGDIGALLACYAPNAEVWHNFDDLTINPHDHTEGPKGLFDNFPVRRITEVRRHPIAGGVVQQHVMVLERSDGRAFTQPICIIFHIESGKIRRLEEYVDLARMA